MFLPKPEFNSTTGKRSVSGALVCAVALASLAGSGCAHWKKDGAQSSGTESAISRPAPAPRQASPAVTTRAAPAPRSNESYGQSTTLLRDGHPERHVVVRGDTLWDISGMFLRDPWLWPEIWYVNPQISNPHLIFPGDVISLVWIDGKPRLTVERDGMTAGRERISPQIRVKSLEDAITTIPYDLIAPFLTKPTIMDKKQIRDAPYIVGIKQYHLVAGSGFSVYVRNSNAAVGTRYNVYAIGDPYIDPDNGRQIGIAADYVGQGRITRAGETATLFLTETRREALPGDRLVLEKTELPLNFFPSAPKVKVEGRIIDVMDGISKVGQYQVVVLNRGLSDGVEPGHVLSVWQTGEVIRDRYANTGFTSAIFHRKIQMPEEVAGRLLVFRSLEDVSFGLITSATSEISSLDIVRNPQ